MKKKTKKKYKKLFFIIPIILIILVCFCLIINFNKIKVEFNDNITVNINETFSNLDGIKTIKNGTIITEKEDVDTSKLGYKEITIEVKNIIGKKKEYSYKINIIDTESPKIDAPKSYETDYNKEIDLLSDVKVTDNSQENIEITIEGEVDYKKAGTYTLYYKAQDSSGNETKEEFTITVKEQKKDSGTTQPNQPTTSTPSSTNTTFTTSKGFQGITKNGITYIDGIIIANKSYSLPSTYNTGGLTSETSNAFNKMISAAALEGIDIRCQSGFRSYETQKRLYNNYASRDGSTAADIYSARPGHSEHQTGLSCDICSNTNPNACINSNFDNTKEAQWLSENAANYGLILRYPKGKTNETGYIYESWHFRYVGTDLAKKLYNNGDWITLESYFGITSEYQ